MQLTYFVLSPFETLISKISCIDGPNQRVLSLAEWYTEEGTLAADAAAEAAKYVSGFLKHWFSRKYRSKSTINLIIKSIRQD